MRRATLLIALAVVALSLSFAGSAAAKPGKPNPNKPAKARVTWSVDRVEQTVAPGETVQVPVTLTSSADLSNISLAASGGLAKFVTVAPGTVASLKAGESLNVTLTITMPAEGARCGAGVVKVRAGNRTVPAPLKVKLLLPGGCEE